MIPDKKGVSPMKLVCESIASSGTTDRDVNHFQHNLTFVDRLVLSGGVVTFFFSNSS